MEPILSEANVTNQKFGKRAQRHAACAHLPEEVPMDDVEQLLRDAVLPFLQVSNAVKIDLVEVFPGNLGGTISVFGDDESSIETLEAAAGDGSLSTAVVEEA